MKARKKILSLLLAGTLISANLPIGTPEVYAAGEAADTPSKTTYADKEELQKNYDLVDDTEDKPVQKVYFGYNGDTEKTPQVWKIAGKDPKITGDNIVLFADSPMTVDNQAFADLVDYPYEKKCKPSELGITYGKGVVPDSGEITVYINHYGSSILRSTLRSMATDEDYFTTAQQALMKETTITTKDMYGDNGNYTTTDILYAAYGVYGANQYVTVGTNNKDGDLNDGLRIDGSNWWDAEFWLRAPADYGMELYALRAWKEMEDSGLCSIVVHNGPVEEDSSVVVPAFDLNLTSVLFASTASAATAQSGNATKIKNDVMTFRWADKEGNDAKIKSTATWTAEEVNVKNNDRTNNVYICVQGKNGQTDWIWSKKVNEISENKVTAQTITSALKDDLSPADSAVDLTKCKIWLETTDTNEGLTYAKEAQAQTHSVSITAGKGLEITSGNGTQTVVQKADIKPITVKAKSGYHLTAEDIKAIEEQLKPSGLTLKEADAGFTISGAPTGDVSLTLPAASPVKAKVKVTGIKITGTSKKIAAGKKVKLQAAVTPANAENRAVVWTSSNKKVATVDSKGVVTVKKGSGGKKVTITATAADGSGVKASYKITSMKGAVKKIRITGAKSVKAGKSLKLKARVTASKGADKTLTWKSSHTQYATVSSSGKVKTYKAGKGKKVKITAMATDGSKKKKTVTIKIK